MTHFFRVNFWSTVSGPYAQAYHKVAEYILGQDSSKRSHIAFLTLMGPSSVRGATDQQVCQYLVKAFNMKMTPQQLEREIDDLSKIKLPQSPLQKGVERLLKHLHSTGIQFALATNSSTRAVRLHVATKPKIFEMFHHMVCASDPGVDRPKPHPDIYLAAADKFSDKPKPIKCLVFEDSVVGLEAAIAAGMQVVWTPPYHMPLEYTRKATVVLKSLVDFKPEIFGLPPFTDQPGFQRKRP